VRLLLIVGQRFHTTVIITFVVSHVMATCRHNINVFYNLCGCA